MLQSLHITLKQRIIIMLLHRSVQPTDLTVLCDFAQTLEELFFFI